jgi:nucleotide-binding universal stress UspA family protein
MSFIKRILVPIDFLDSSKTAVKFAIEIAKKNRSKIFLLHAYRLMQPNIILLPYFKSEDYSGPELKKELENYSHVQYENFEREVFKDDKIDHEFLTEVGFTAQAIESTVEEKDIDLVVMGTTNSKNVRDFWGSNTLEVIRTVKCPVLAIPNNSTFQGIGKITLASDYKKVANSNIFKFIKNLVANFSAEIQILNLSHENITVSNNILQAQKEFDQIFEGVDHSFHFKSCDDFSIAISEHLKVENTDILIIIPRDHNYFSNLFKKNLTNAVVLNTKIPLIAIHE